MLQKIIKHLLDVKRQGPVLNQRDINQAKGALQRRVFEKLIDDDRLLTLCQEVDQRRMQSTVIENDFQTSEFFKNYPEVRSLIGVAVGDESDQGWLIAINRAVPNGIDPTRTHAPW